MVSKATPQTAEGELLLKTVGIDIGKDIFHIVGFDPSGKIVLRRKFRRLSLEAVFQKLPRCIAGMEACLSAHFISRRLRALGFEPRIIPAIYVKPFSKGQKNDYNDAEAIAEAALRPNLKTEGEVARATRSPGLPSSTLALGLAAHGDDQSDPRFSDRARHCSQIGRRRAQDIAAGDLAQTAS